MKLLTIKYYFEEAFKSIARNSLMSLSSIATVASCIFILISSYCIAINIDFILEQIENSVGLSVFLDDDLTTDEVNSLFYKIVDIEHVSSVDYISREDALQAFAEKLEESDEILSGLEKDNPLPRSFSITLDSTRYQDEVLVKLNDLTAEGISKIRHTKDTTQMLISINNVVRLISIVIILMLAILSVVIIMNTIKLTVNNRKTEINIMKYVGATDWFIKWPFVIEGALIGLVGAVVPALLSWLGYAKALDVIATAIPVISTLMTFKTSMDIFPTLLPFSIVFGIVIGLIGSVGSMRRYLDV